MSDDGHPEGPSRRAVLAAGAVLAANALLGCEDTVPVEPTRDSLVDGEAMTDGKGHMVKVDYHQRIE